MEIDPRLRAGSDSHSAETPALSHSHSHPHAPAHSYASSPATRHPDLSASSSRTTSEYPDPPSHFCGEHVHSAAASATTNDVSYYGASSAHSLYQGGSSADVVDPNDPYADLKRPRACEACRQLKVRCEPDMNNPNGSCKRCAKARRSCVVTVPTRKRQKKTDSRVAELERKIDALTASLQASHGQDPLVQQQQQHQHQHQTPPVEPPREEHAGRRWLGPTAQAAGSTTEDPQMVLSGAKRQYSGEIKDSRNESILGRETTSPGSEHADGRHWRFPEKPAPKSQTSDFVDVIDRGLVSVEVASDAFNRYVDRMANNIPMVVFPSGTTMTEVRRSKPILLHAIVAAAIGAIQPDLHLPLVNDFYKVIADRIIVRGEKSLEIMQALLVTCNWYAPPDNFEELKFYQLSHLALTVGIDIGMYRKFAARNKHFSLVKDLMAKKTSSQDLDSPEARRAWLGCYFVAVQVSTSLRRPILVRWSSYMDECVEVLEKSPDASPTDKSMIHWAKLAHIIEEINMQFVGDDATATGAFVDPKFQYTLKVFEKQLEQWRREARPYYSPMLKQAECIVDLYMHEGAMHMELNEEQNTAEDYSSPTSAAHMNALSACLTSIHQALDTICSIDVKDLVSLPVVALARTSFAVVALIKLFSLVSAPETRIGQVIDPSSLRVEYYMDKVIQHYNHAGNLPGGRTPNKFSVVLRMLRSWFVKRKDQIPALQEAMSGKRSVVLSQDGPDHEPSQPPKPGPTPLHLLSEVAMGEPKNPSQLSYARGQTQTQSPLTSQTPDSLPHSTLLSNTSQSQPLDPAATTTPSSDPWPQYPSATPRQYYPPFTSPYQNLPSSSTYPDPNADNLVMSGPSAPTPGFFLPELGLQVGGDPDNLFALENMFGYGVLNFPMDFGDGTAGGGSGEGMGFY
ncbi:hypothetical protein P170DRAFT_353064 [Aspergillus steynii IBT 23096]|uniref:Zn(2)-C6 fungal-type domain-containing protein n=1 Tax=Aspergillus steynii IBT 23096 TaxID=1392250 RepID=A0A2I2GF79_9EURO|nr:uncharacterized protein P170DRAFT_353064 [Aspergillus steynii IBT 23096]PLB51543.1 hypothetical protein P170DRAFT_353064 [Aspergillus steynii IBT 23096]